MSENTDQSTGFSLLDLVKNAITPDVLSQLSSFLGVSTDQAKRGLMVAVPAIIAGLLRKASTEAGAQNLIGSMKELSLGEGANRTVASVLSGDTQTMGSVQRFLSGLFGDKLSGLAPSLAKYTNLPDGVIVKLMTFATPFVMGIVAKKTAANGNDPSWLSRFLSSQKSSITAALPAGLGLLPSVEAIGGGATAERKKALAWLIPAVAILLGLSGLWWARNSGKAPSVSDSTPVATVSHAFDDLASLLSSGDATRLPTEVAFNEITFEFGNAKLTPSGSQAVEKLASMLNSHPDAVVRLEGHTDGVGNAAANKQLSQNRAEAVKKILVARGVAQSHLTTTGVGDEKPIASDATDEGRARNRRLGVVVLSTTGDTSVAH